MTDLQLLELMTAKTNPGGLIMFYTRSMAFDRAVPVIAEWEKQRRARKEEEYKTLLIYRKR
jgi:hypothetical protein